MANIKSAEKRIRLSALRRDRNRSQRSRMRSAVKRLRRAIAEEDAKQATELLQPTLSLVDHTAQKKAVPAKAAARTKSRLVKALRKLST